MKLYDDCVMERHYFNHFLMITTGEVSKLVTDFVLLSIDLCSVFKAATRVFGEWQHAAAVQRLCCVEAAGVIRSTAVQHSQRFS